MKRLFKSIRLYYLIGAQFSKRHKWIFLGSLIIVVLLILTQLKYNLYINPNSLSEGLVGTYQQYDLPLEITNLLSKGLVVVDENNKMVPGLATWETNNDATNFKFKLKEGLNWSDQTPVKSTDLNFGIPNTEVTYPNDQIIEFKLKEPYSPFPSLLTKPIFKKGTLLGIGYYKVVRIEKSRIFITKITLAPLKSNLPQLTIRFYPNEKTAITGFQLGEVQSLLGVTESIPNTDLVKMKSQTDTTKVVTILYAVKDSLLSNRSLRQALSYSAPKIGEQTLAISPFPTNSWGYSNQLKNYLENIDDANSALGRAKVTINKEDLNKELVLTTVSGLQQVGEAVVSSWKKLGLNAQLKIEQGIPQNFQALLITQSIPQDPDQYFLWHSTQDKTNLTKYSSARVDKDLEDGRKLINLDDRKAKYLDFQKSLLEDSPATFLYFPKHNVYYLNKAENNLNKVLPLQLLNFVKIQ